MCFNQSMSFAFSALGLAVAAFVWMRSNNAKLTVGILFFFTMEFLQGLQYFWCALNTQLDCIAMTFIANYTYNNVGLINATLQSTRFLLLLDLRIL